MKILFEISKINKSSYYKWLKNAEKRKKKEQEEKEKTSRKTNNKRSDNEKIKLKIRIAFTDKYNDRDYKSKP